MPLASTDIERWVEGRDGDPWLYYRVAFGQLAPWIFRSGIQPRAVTGTASFHSDMPSRAGHVYLNSRADAVAGFESGVGEADPHFRVAIWDLDPQRLDSDEDKVCGYAKSKHAVEHLPGFDNLQWPKRGPGVASWMDENSNIVDQPEWVLLSLTKGSVAHRGAIPPETIDLLDKELRRDWYRAAPSEPWPETIPRLCQGMPYRRRPLPNSTLSERARHHAGRIWPGIKHRRKGT